MKLSTALVPLLLLAVVLATNAIQWRPKNAVQITGYWVHLTSVYSLSASGPAMDYMDNDVQGYEPALLTYSVTNLDPWGHVSNGNFSLQTNPWLDGPGFSMDIGSLIVVHNGTGTAGQKPGFTTAFWFQATTEKIYFGAELDNADWSCGIPFPGQVLPYQICKAGASFDCWWRNVGHLHVDVQIC